MPFTILNKGQMRKSTKPIVWNATLNFTFKELKNRACMVASLLLLDPSKYFHTENDASHYPIGVVFYLDVRTRMRME